MNDYIFEQFTMFNFKSISNNILYWENALSYPNDLPKFIEWADTMEESYLRIPKWNNSIKNIDIKSLKQSSGIDLLDKRTLYIINSFTMGFEMCFERYCQLKQIDQKQYFLDLNNIIIKKDTEELPKDISSNAAFLAITYINDNYENGELLFLPHNISIKPKAGTVLIIPVEELNGYVPNKHDGTKYIAYSIIYKNILEGQNE